jgi:predicted AAA+ superfamily ATPase
MLRKDYLLKISQAFRVNPVVALLGPRQSGKTTLARLYSDHFTRHKNSASNYFDLENPLHLARLNQPMMALESLSGLIIIDEIQRHPELFPILRVLADRTKAKTQFLILGSASRDLIHQSSETLAGRITYLDVHPFSLKEVGNDKINRLWIRGGFPKSFLAKSEATSWEWREHYVRTFLERDIPQLGINIPAATIRRFWMMLAHAHGQIFNASEIGRSLGAADTTIKRYLDILTGTFMIRALQPWHENIGKRQVKRPKIYFRDSGLFHLLLSVPSLSQLQIHPKLGASWEGFALETIIQQHDSRQEDCFFWSVHTQMELDLLIIHQGKRLGFEIKYQDAPKPKDKHRDMIKLLKLDSLTFVTPTQEKPFSYEKNIHCCGLYRIGT